MLSIKYKRLLPQKLYPSCNPFAKLIVSVGSDIQIFLDSETINSNL